MSLICSVLLPSRKRFNRLREAVQSLVESGPELSSFDVIVRLDYDDQESLENVRFLRVYRNVKIVVGPRFAGYKDLNLIYTDLAVSTPAPWVFIFNDDSKLNPLSDWVKQLSRFNPSHHLVQPETVTNGGSTYHCCKGGPFPIVPNRSWEKCGLHILPDPVDTQIDILLSRNGWRTCYLEGMTVFHNRDTQDVLDQHRL